MKEPKIPFPVFDLTKIFDIPKKKWSCAYLHALDHFSPKLSRDTSALSLPYIRKTLATKIIDGDISQLSSHEKYRSSSNRRRGGVEVEQNNLQKFEQKVRKHIIPIYKIDEETHKKYINIKHNNVIALKDNFDVKKYQRSLVSVLININIDYSLHL